MVKLSVHFLFCGKIKHLTLKADIGIKMSLSLSNIHKTADVSHLFHVKRVTVTMQQYINMNDSNSCDMAVKNYCTSENKTAKGTRF